MVVHDLICFFCESVNIYKEIAWEELPKSLKEENKGCQKKSQIKKNDSVPGNMYTYIWDFIHNTIILITKQYLAIKP